ncbi:hypothetical protein GCM10027289_12330 [Tsukamurella serpentis]
MLSARSIAASSASWPEPAAAPPDSEDAADAGVPSSLIVATYWPSVRTRYITNTANAKIATDATAIRISKKMTMLRV